MSFQSFVLGGALSPAAVSVSAPLTGVSAWNRYGCSRGRRDGAQRQPPRPRQVTRWPPALRSPHIARCSLPIHLLLRAFPTRATHTRVPISALPSTAEWGPRCLGIFYSSPCPCTLGLLCNISGQEGLWVGAILVRFELIPLVYTTASTDLVTWPVPLCGCSI